MIFHHFLKIDFSKISVFGYFFTFDRYFEAWEHQNRTRHEKILPGSYFQNFWPDGKLIGARRRSKLGCAVPRLSFQSDPGGRGLGGPGGVSEASPGTNELPIRPKTLRIRLQKYFCMLRSILMLPGLEIPFKSEKITKNRIYKNPIFEK